MLFYCWQHGTPLILLSRKDISGLGRDSARTIVPVNTSDVGIVSRTLQISVFDHQQTTLAYVALFPEECLDFRQAIHYELHISRQGWKRLKEGHRICVHIGKSADAVIMQKSEMRNYDNEQRAL